MAPDLAGLLADGVGTGESHAMGWFSKNKARLKELLMTYGWVAAVVWFGIFGLVICGFALALKTGIKAEGAAETTGVWGAAYVATQLTKPLRIIATIFITPVVARWVGKVPAAAEAEAEAKVQAE